MAFPICAETITTAAPKATVGQRETTDSNVRPQNPSSNNANMDNQLSGSGRSYHCMAGMLITIITLAVVTIMY